ncbi:hypothetical protein GCM10022240_21520 [Microbacterium kribbense]|uniref:DUF2269 family protein n=1 Tax=Microbacterium kribbense TaxID=433645 RepID=A0ABP7GSD9_9MICO
MSTLLSILHVATAVFIVGPMAIIPMTGLRALRSGNAAQARTLARSTAVFSWLSLITFVLGFGVLGKNAGAAFTTGWILSAMITYAIAFLLSVIVIVPQMHKAADLAADTPAGDKPAGYGAIVGSSGVASLLLVATVVLMIWRP